MSYLKNYMVHRGTGYVPTAGFFDTASKYLNQAGDIIKTGTTILNDPALPKIIANVVELNSLEKSDAKTPSGQASGATGQGIGLRKVVRPLELFVFYRKNPWIAPVAIGGLIGLPFVLGYLLGRPGRSK